MKRFSKELSTVSGIYHEDYSIHSLSTSFIKPGFVLLLHRLYYQADVKFIYFVVVVWVLFGHAMWHVGS